MSNKTKTTTKRAIKLRLADHLRIAENDYKIVELDLNPENRVIVVAIPLAELTAGWNLKKLNEVRLIIPKDTPFTVLK